MKILFYGINYFPESIGIGKYSTELCEWLAAQGHKVEVITAMPFYPYWKVMDAYAKKGWHSEEINKVIVHRCPLYVPTSVTGKSRIAHELSFAFSSALYWMKCLFKKYDVVICIAPPLQTGLVGVIYKAIHQTLFIYHIQDLQMDVAKKLGLIKSKLILKVVARFEMFLFNKAHFISTISEGMKKNISLKGIPPEKLMELKNWIDTQKMAPEEPDTQVLNMFGIDSSKKIVLYSGNIGEKQGLEIIITVAEFLRSTNIVFLVIGDGSYKLQFEESVQAKKLNNVRIFPLQPYELLCKILNIASVHLVLQKKAAADLVMPSKLAAILSVGGMAIVTAEKGTTLYNIIDQNKMAVIVDPENPEALRDCVVSTLKRDMSVHRQNARRYAQINLEKESVMTNFQNFLLQETARGK